MLFIKLLNRIVDLLKTEAKHGIQQLNVFWGKILRITKFHYFFLYEPTALSFRD